MAVESHSVAVKGACYGIESYIAVRGLHLITSALIGFFSLLPGPSGAPANLLSQDAVTAAERFARIIASGNSRVCPVGAVSITTKPSSPKATVRAKARNTAISSVQGGAQILFQQGTPLFIKIIAGGSARSASGLWQGSSCW